MRTKRGVLRFDIAEKITVYMIEMLGKLLEIEGAGGAVQAEICDGCHSYAKMLHQAKDMAVEPMADDLASLGLDMLVSEAGYQRASNPLVITTH